MSTQPFRLALRAEGKDWNAYLARQGTMDGAVLMASIRRSLAEDPAVKEAFIETMKLAMGAAVRAVGLGDISWPDPPQQAPESERSGNG